MKNIIKGLAPTLFAAGLLAVMAGGSFAGAGEPQVSTPPTTMVSAYVPVANNKDLPTCVPHKGGPGPCQVTSKYWEELGYPESDWIRSVDDLQIGVQYCAHNARWGYEFRFVLVSIGFYSDYYPGIGAVEQYVVYFEAKDNPYFFASEFGLEPDMFGEMQEGGRIYRTKDAEVCANAPI